MSTAKDPAEGRRPTPCLENRIHAWIHSSRSETARPRLRTNHTKLAHGKGDVEGAYTYAVTDDDRVLAVGDDLASIARQLGLIPRCEVES